MLLTAVRHTSQVTRKQFENDSDWGSPVDQLNTAFKWYTKGSLPAAVSLLGPHPSPTKHCHRLNQDFQDIGLWEQNEHCKASIDFVVMMKSLL